MIVTVFLYVAYSYKGVGIVNALWSGLSILAMVAIGTLVFKEKIKAKEWIGILFILVGLVTLNIAN